MSNWLFNWAYHHQDTIWGDLFWPVFLAEILGVLLDLVGGSMPQVRNGTRAETTETESVACNA